MFTEAIAAILAHHCTTDIVRGIEAGASAQLLSGALHDAGFLELLAPEERGGADVGWPDFFEVVSLCGAWAVPLPLAQTIAARRLTTEPQQLPVGFISFAPALTRGSDGTFHAHNVPSGRTSSHVIGAMDEVLVLLAVSDASASSSGRSASGTHADGIHGSLDASFCWPAHVAKGLRGGIPAAELAPIAALLHAGLLAGAMKRCFDLTMSYANERAQFGKPIGKFQAIQHQLSVMAEHVAAGRMAAEAAFGTDARRPGAMACAVAKARTSEAAQHVAAIAHAVHGAIGVTAEYDLQLFTRRLHAWRMAHGSEACWHRVLGQCFLDSTQPLAVDFVRTVWEGASA
ncbi:acyl-CoA dehydrogenase family protein [Variovorax sp. N23]|uniref:acyl-CoA dehydrogenase family protein n=1 Tax=Variovorax sp. N23 TaxID=2980555 RepID=UPI0021C61E52|nr:acyl-CoA dehydrogenase family protein [Variovorax sp. N23]MCU4119089.1 acyl-CoA dehydrogenase family protein [Variovorax sp. N23]